MSNRKAPAKFPLLVLRGRIYCAKLRADAQDPLGGSWSRSARQGVLALADAWEAGAPADDVAASCLAALNGGSSLDHLRAGLIG